MSAEDAQFAFDALQMGFAYFDEIGDDCALAELKLELEQLIAQSPVFVEQARTMLASF
ncbi:MAG: hypothetical protein KC422_12740 [Trueperaceae bacterium]|nr:hypothetical protein [Trueperaceae bacterium]